jgi:hypothetical protein
MRFGKWVLTRKGARKVLMNEENAQVMEGFTRAELSAFLFDFLFRAVSKSVLPPRQPQRETRPPAAVTCQGAQPCALAKGA